MDNLTTRTSSQDKLISLFQELIDEGYTSYDDLCESDKAVSTSLYWNTLPIHNEFEPIGESEHSDKVIFLIKKLLSRQGNVKETEKDLINQIENNAIRYCEKELDRLFKDELKIFHVDSMGYDGSDLFSTDHYQNIRGV